MAEGARELGEEEWAATAKLTPVLENHDPTKVLGWCTRVSFNRKQARALFWGELDGPDARRVARLVKAGMFDGLSPHIRSHRGEVFYPYSGRWSDGDVSPGWSVTTQASATVMSRVTNIQSICSPSPRRRGRTR